MRHELRTEIDIEAPPDRVWAELADLNAYADWNPFITRAEGAAEAGRRLSLRMQPATSACRASSTAGTGSS